MSFFCEECEYVTNKKYNLIRHHNNKHLKKELKIQKEEKHIQKEEKHICKKCNKKYKTKKYLIEHEKKCNGLNILTCPKCMITFSTTSNKSKHIRKDSCKAKSIIHLVNKETNIENKPNLYINTNIINNTIINNFGNERTDYITLDDMIKIFKCSGDNIIPKYIELKEFPENHNIKYENNKGCLIKNDDKWGLINLEVISDLIKIHMN
jgi:hypothetical protein